MKITYLQNIQPGIDVPVVQSPALDPEDAEQVTPLAFRTFATVAVPFQLCQQDILGGREADGDGRAGQILGARPKQGLASERHAGFAVKIDFHHGGQMNEIGRDLPDQSIENHASIDVIRFGQAADELVDVAGAERGDDIDIVGGAGYTVQRTRQGSADIVGDLKLVADDDYGGQGEQRILIHARARHATNRAARSSPYSKRTNSAWAVARSRSG